MSDVNFKFHLYTLPCDINIPHKWRCEFTMYNGTEWVNEYITEIYRKEPCEAFRDGIEKVMELVTALEFATSGPINFTYEAGF